MKPLISIALLVVATSSFAAPRPTGAQSIWTADGQKLADIARNERSRRGAATQAAKIYTSADMKPASPRPVGVEGAKKPTEEEETKPTANPLEDWGKELGNLQADIQKLKDQRTALQNELTSINNRFFSPVTDSGAQLEAQTKMTAVQKRLADNLKDLTEAQSKLEKLAGGSPTK